jgi:hypothetical protein
VSFARDGFTYIAIAAFVAAGMYAAALNRRSWALWLIAFALTIVALWVAYFFHEPRLPVGRAERVASYEEGMQVPRQQPMRLTQTTRQVDVLPLTSAARRVGDPMLDGGVSLPELRIQ